MRLCNARTHTGGYCRKCAPTGRLRCHVHAGRPEGTPEHPNSRAARIEGRRRWVEQMRAAKARGEVERFPNGRRAKGLPRLSKDRNIRKAQRILEKRMAERDIVASPERQWSELTMPEKLSRAAEIGLDVAAKIINDGAAMLERDGLEGCDYKLAALVKDAALSMVADQIKVDVAKLNSSATSTAGLSDEQKRQRARQAIIEAFAERPPFDDGKDAPPHIG